MVLPNRNPSAGAAEPAFDDFLGARLLIPWGELLLDKTALQPGQAVLEITAGPPSLASLIWPRLSPGGRVETADISSQIMAAAHVRSSPGGGRLKRGAPTPISLDVPRKSFNLAVCSQALSLIPDPASVLSAVFRLLKPGGQAAFSIWCDAEANPYYAAIASSYRKVRSRLNSSLKRQESFHRYYQPGELRGMFAQAGFQSIELSRASLPLVFEGGIPQALAGVAATGLAASVSDFSLAQRALFNQEMAISLDRFLSEGKLVVPTSAYIMLARV